jgi:hypothetical protein
MSRPIIAAALSLVALAATPAAAQTASDAPPRSGAPARLDSASDPKHIVCRSETTTGSHFVRRYCLSREAWAEVDRKRAAAVQTFARHNDQAAGAASAAGAVAGN